jgi:hypothetical protein
MTYHWSPRRSDAGPVPGRSRGRDSEPADSGPGLWPAKSRMCAGPRRRLSGYESPRHLVSTNYRARPTLVSAGTARQTSGRAADSSP